MFSGIFSKPIKAPQTKTPEEIECDQLHTLLRREFNINIDRALTAEEAIRYKKEFEDANKELQKKCPN